MKPLVVVLAVATSLGMSGCATDTPPAAEVQDHLESGPDGLGQPGPINRGMDDPITTPRAGNADPTHL